jgi:hypothetical protein
MKLEWKIDPYSYPLVLIVAFVIGFILAMALGFRPEHGERQERHGGALPPAIVQTLAPGEFMRL